VPADRRHAGDAAIASTVRAMTARSCSGVMPACFSQRQPWQLASWPRLTASATSQGVALRRAPAAREGRLHASLLQRVAMRR
jgi:hypothetical protein